MGKRLNGKTILETAAAQGIGKACVEAFQQEGAQVIASDINASRLDDLAMLPGVETRLGAISRNIQRIPNIAAGAVSDVMETGLVFLNPNQLTNQSIINVLEGKVPRSSVQGIDMQAQIANSTLPNKSELLGINENLMNLPRDLDQVIETLTNEFITAENAIHAKNIKFTKLLKKLKNPSTYEELFNSANLL